MFIDENSTRAELEDAAAEFLSADVIAALSDGTLLDVIQEWIEAGDECAAAA